MKGMDKASMVRRNKSISNLPKYDEGVPPFTPAWVLDHNLGNTAAAATILGGTKGLDVWLEDRNLLKFLNNWLSNRTDQLKENAKYVDPKRPLKSWWSGDDIAKAQINNANVSKLYDYRNFASRLDAYKNGKNTKDFEQRPESMLGATYFKGYNRPEIYIKPYTPLNHSTPIHEFSHAATNFLPVLEAKIQDILNNSKNRSNYTDKYLDKPEEIYSRLMLFRYDNKLDPKKPVTQQDIDNWRKAGVKSYEFLNRYDDNTLLQLFNDVAKTNDNKNTVSADKGVSPKHIKKYDIGTTPISSGYQRSTNSIPVGYVSLNSTDLSNMVSGQNAANTSLYFKAGTQLATLGKTIGDVVKEGAAKTISGAAGAGMTALATIPSAMSLVGAIGSKGSFDGIGGDLLGNLASKNTEYTNGVAYRRIGGVDSGSIMRAARARELGENVNLTTSAVGTGAGLGGTLGSLISPGIGTLVGTGIGALVGGIGSLFGWNNKEQKEQRSRLENFRIASNAANQQEEAVAASTGRRNEFYRTHGATYGADKGLSPSTSIKSTLKKGKPNARLSVDEYVTEHNKEGKVTDYLRIDAPGHIPHADDILVHLQGNNGVVGSTVDSTTGLPRNEIARRIDEDQTLTKKEKNELFTDLMVDQDLYLKQTGLDMKIRNYDAGKYMNLLGIAPGAWLFFSALKRKADIKGEPSVAINPYVESPAARNYVDNMFQMYDPTYNLLREGTRQNKKTLYALNNAPLSPGLRLGGFSQYIADKMYRDAAIRTQGAQMRNENWLNANKTGLAYAQDVQLKMMQGYMSYIEQMRQQEAARQKLMDTEREREEKALNSTIGNILNNYWQKMNIDLYRQYLKSKLFEDNTQTAANATVAGMPYVVPENQLRLASVIPGPLSAPQVIPDYLKGWEERDADEKKKKKKLNPYESAWGQ